MTRNEMVPASERWMSFLKVDNGAELAKLARLLPDVDKAGVQARVQQFMYAVRANGNLEACSPQSIAKCALDCFTLDLWPGPKKHMHLIPFKRAATPIPGYRGLVRLMLRAGIGKVSASVVYDCDEWYYKAGSEDVIIHTPSPPSLRGDSPVRVGAYAVAHYPNGVVQPCWLWAEEVEAIKKKAPGARKADSPWNSELPHEVNEMWKKTAIRRLTKLTGDDDMRLAHAVQLVDAADGFEPRRPRRQRPTVISVDPDDVLNGARTYADSEQDDNGTDTDGDDDASD